jgi:hypothetical protein
VGLIQRTIEAADIPTVSISINRSYTARVKPPRSIFLDWPFGHPLGQPGRIDRQNAVLREAFSSPVLGWSDHFLNSQLFHIP